VTLAGPGDEKVCVSCGRRITWRKKWARDWANVRYCSDACRRRKNSSDDGPMEQAILDLLADRAAGATICPSEAARQVDPAGWAARMEDARRAARRLVDRGMVEITQGGRVVDPSTARGPIRVRLVRKG
jgi:hypothetical protein